MKILYPIFVICSVGYIGLLLFAFFFSEKLIFPTPKSTYEKIDGIKMLPLDDGRKIATLFFENKKSEVCVIYSHGNGEDLGKIYELMQQYRDKLNVNVLVYDYCGYGIKKYTRCPKCGSEDITRIERMNGYLGYSRVNGRTMYADHKLEEFKDRVSM